MIATMKENVMDLVEFLRARFDEDEQGAHRAPYYPARALADVESKRRILDWLAEDARFDMPAVKAQAASREEWYLITVARTTIKLLALPYAGHPDYDPAWRPQ